MLFESSGSLLSTSDDEIVWSVSDSDLSLSSESSVFPTSDDDYVVLGLPQRSSQISTGQSISDTDEILAPRLSGLSLDESSISGGSGRTLATGNVKKTKKRTAKKRKAKKIQAEPVLVHSRAGGATVQNRPKKAVARAGPPGARSDNDSEKTYSDSEDIRGTAAHKEAVQYITSFLNNNPAGKSNVCQLTLLQSLIIELGISSCPSIMPKSLTAARALLKSRAFLNIREYLAVREQGQAALRRVMHPSRTALIRDIRKKRNPISLKWAKQNGLQVFLVTCFH